MAPAKRDQRMQRNEALAAAGRDVERSAAEDSDHSDRRSSERSSRSRISGARDFSDYTRMERERSSD